MTTLLEQILVEQKEEEYLKNPGSFHSTGVGDIVYHNSKCGPAKEISLNNLQPDNNGRRLCEDCNKNNKKLFEGLSKLLMETK